MHSKFCSKMKNISRYQFIFKKKEFLKSFNQYLITLFYNINKLGLNLDKSRSSLKQKAQLLSEEKEKMNELEKNITELNDKCNSIQQLLKKVQEEKEDLEEKCDNLNRKLRRKEYEIHEKEEEIRKINEDIKDRNSKIEELNGKIEDNNLDKSESNLKQKTQLLDEKKGKINELEKNFTELNNKYNSIHRLLKKAQEEKEELEEECDDLDSKLRRKGKEIHEKEEEIKKINEDIKDRNSKIERLNSKIEDNKLRENLIGSLISAKNENRDVNKFSDLLNNNFLNFTSNESSLKNEAEVLIKLQEIESELKMLSAFPAFFSKRTIAVAGGFSSGKSAFISSFFQNKSCKLPSDISPTTAIPTYVLTDKSVNKNIKNVAKESSSTQKLIGVSLNGGSVDLLNIDPNLIIKLQHNFIQSFNFSLKDIMPYMFLITQLHYEHVCFIDTPGYNPATSKVGFTSEDINSAKESLKDCEAVLWLIGADANGTIPKTDLDFLKEVLNEKPKPIYFVLNKADVKPKKEIKQILIEFENVLKANNISYMGISAFSSLDKKEFAYKRCSLSKFLDSLNNPLNRQEDLVKKLYDVDQMYQFAIKKDIKERDALANAIDDIAYHLNMEDFAEGEHYIYDVLDDIKSYFNVKEQKNHLKELDVIIQKLKKAIDSIFDKTSSLKRTEIDSDDIEVKTWDLDKYQTYEENNDIDE